MLKPASDPSPSTPRRTTMVAAAAAVALAIAGVLAIVLLRDDSGQAPVDPPATTIAPDDAEALAAVGEQLVAAFDSRDREAVAELVADDASPIVMLGVTTKSELIDLLGYIEGADLGFEVEECVGSEPNQVQCTVLQSSGFANAARVGRGQALMLMTVEDGQVVAMRYGRPDSHGRAYTEFRRFVFDADPDAPAKMWWENSAGEPYPLLTEESFALFEQYTQEFTDSKP